MARPVAPLLEVLRELGVDKIYIPEEPEYGTAVGAALVAAKE